MPTFTQRSNPQYAEACQRAYDTINDMVWNISNHTTDIELLEARAAVVSIGTEVLAMTAAIDAELELRLNLDIDALLKGSVA